MNKNLLTIFILIFTLLIGTNSFAISLDDFHKVNLRAFVADEDGDGVEDQDDVCPQTPTGETVDASGCSESQKDDDEDGVPNNVDTCPFTFSGEAVDAVGCSQSQADDDEDGVPNNIDLCPNTASGESVDVSGCSESQADDDGDGVPNNIDTCLFTFPGEAVDAFGCSESQADDDEDGIPNNIDLCPNTATGEAVDFFGCSESQADDDGDGVPNNIDTCPFTFPGEVVDAFGCSESQADDDGDGVLNSVDLCPDTPAGELVDFSGCSITTDTTSGTITDSGTNTDTTTGDGSDTGDGSNTGGDSSTSTQTCLIGMFHSNGPQLQYVAEGDAVTDVIYQFDSTCSNVTIDVVGLPNGMDWIVQDNTITITGQALSAPGGYFYTIFAISANFSTGSIAEASISGEIYIETSSTSTNTNGGGGSNTSTQTCSLDVSLSDGQQFQNVAEGATLTDVVYQLDSTCENTSVDVVGLPPGIDWISQDNTIIISGQALSRPGNYFYTIFASSLNFSNGSFVQASINGEIIIESNTTTGTNSGGGSNTSSQTCSTELFLSSGEQFQNVAEEGVITDVIYQYDTTCSDVTIEVIGLPAGISFERNDNTILISGQVQAAPGSYFYTIYANSEVITSFGGFGIETSINGVITVDGSQSNGGSGFADADKDGVPDFLDICPDSKEGTSVDVYGCSKDQSLINTVADSDNDGISDPFDGCPDTPEGEEINEFGCSESQLNDNNPILGDDDNDGVPNLYDLCLDTEEGASVDSFGCSQNESPEAGTFNDADSDGVPDEIDVCPDTKEGASVDYFGCADKQIPGESALDDSDNDGVPNISDACPNTEADAIVDFYGCSKDQGSSDTSLDDTDADGVPDFYDACPDTAKGAVINVFGCAEEQTPQEGAITDTDNDGIPDPFDLCPDTEQGSLVNQFGCNDTQTPIQGSFNDTDMDGIPDEFDACPDTQPNEFVNEYGCTYTSSQTQKTFIPDNAFEQTLIDLGYDDVIDNLVDTDVIQSLEVLNLSASARSDGSKINDLTGIESFTALRELYASGNNLFYIEISNNQSLEILNVDNNFITRIYTGNNPALQTLSVNNNQLYDLYINENQELSNLDIGNNPIFSIDVSNNSNLVSLRLNNTRLQEIDVSSLLGLEGLDVINTDVSCISVSEEQLNQIPSGWNINGSAFYSTNCGYINQFDADNDGVLNELDFCPNTPEGQLVDVNGCSAIDSDEDLDGVPDDVDLCPNTPKNSIVDEFGCIGSQKDLDQDGVPNEFDLCPESPKGIAVNEFGCSEKEAQILNDNADDDRDGVKNALDRCPDTAIGTVVDSYGCTSDETTQQSETDSDLDGVLNEDDSCPDTPIGLVVNSFGCPLNTFDSDHDKVTDDIDLCPDTKEGAVVDQYGCSLAQKEVDSDLDGVLNTIDYCPDTPVYDKVNSNGCSVAQIAIDSDFDGVNNSDDQCPDTKPFQSVNANGCSVDQLDDDQDGVVNSVDQCIGTPKGDKVNAVGCSIPQASLDDDGDGVINSDDNCPNTPTGAEVDNKGCEFLPPFVQFQVFEKTENSRDATDTIVNEYLGKIIVEDPNANSAGDISNITLEIIPGEDSSIFQLKSDSIFLVGRTDYEEKSKHIFEIKATNNKNLSSTTAMELRVIDIPNTYTYTSFSMSVFDVNNESSDSKVDHKRYYNPNVTKGVGKWKIKKKISGGADASLFRVVSSSQFKNEEGESEYYLDFIYPPDYENPLDHDGDNIYEVEVVNVNTNDGEPTLPLSVVQTNIVVPENNLTAIQLQTVSVSPLQDTDGDGIVDIQDNSPLVSNPNQEDSDGDGVGDVSDDADHDGVWNPIDICSDTPYGSLVDKDGCVLFYLAPSNFSLSKIEKCENTNSIRLSVEDTSLTYNVSVSGAANRSESFNSNSWSLDNLSAGDYTVCVTVDGISATEFERCFDLTINDPQPLSVYSVSKNGNETVSYELSGGTNYSITHNGITKQTSESSYTITLAKGQNTVSISTGIACQGIFEQSYFNSDTVVTAPNPFKETLAIYVGGEEMDATIELYSSDGKIIMSQLFALTIMDRTLYIDTSNLINGSYIVKVNNASVNQSQIVIKE